MRTPRGLAAACAAVLVVAACGDDDDDEGAAGAAPTVEELAGTTFTSTSVEGWTLVDGTEVALTFDADGLAANAGCNTLRGSVAITDGQLQVGTMASTTMACDPDLMDQDAWLTSFLEAESAITLEGTTLTITNEDATLVASSS